MDTTLGTITILYADNEVQVCKWFARTAGVGYEVLTANSVEGAKAVLRDSHERISVVLTNFRMPGADGTGLLCFISAEYGNITTIPVTAYADRDLLIRAVNTGRVFKTLEKLYQPEDVWRSLQEALALRQNRLLRTQCLMAIDKTLASLTHELNTPLAAISNFAHGIRMHIDQTEPTPGVLPETGRAADRVQNNVRYCLPVIVTLPNSVRSTYGKPGTVVAPNSAGELICASFDTYPFINAQCEWVIYRVEDGFPIQTLPSCTMLMPSSLTSNAPQALQQTNTPKLEIVVGCGLGPGNTQHMIRTKDNGSSIAPDVLARLTIGPVTTRVEEGGSGMGMISYTRIMQSLGGAIVIDSASSADTRVALIFL